MMLESDCTVRFSQWRAAAALPQAAAAIFCSRGQEVRVNASSAVFGGTAHLVYPQQLPPRHTTARGTAT